MPRIVAGQARGRRLAVPPGVRPTSDRAREALFSTLATLTDLDGARVLDLYAGSGAVGLEALSRGAAEVVMVESNAATVRVIGANIAAVGLAGARVVRAEVARYLAGPPPDDRTAFDLVFADPPYRLTDAALTPVIATTAGPWTEPGALVVVERPSRGGTWLWPTGLSAVKERSYGEGTLWYGRRS